MQEIKLINTLQNDLSFSESSIKKLKTYVSMLLDANKDHNYIGKSTELDIWSRHILDCAQIIKFIDIDKDKNISDLGSGAGLPGVILSIFGENYKFHVKLYEKSPIKRRFLEKVREKLNINFDIFNNVYEEDNFNELIVCRAFKKIEELIKISREMIKKDHKFIILKGKNAEKEINRVSLNSNYRYKLESSMTDKKSKILIIEVKK